MVDLKFFILLIFCNVVSSNFLSLTTPFTNNWAILVSSSRYWFNYRHFSNTLSVYRSVKRLGIPDSNIILMLADEMACNSRNHYTPHVYHQPSKNLELFPSDVEVDYKGYEVTVENFFRILTGRNHQYTPRSKSTSMNERSNLLIYVSGHGGEGFLKFQDNQELINFELHDTFFQMLRNHRFNHILFLVDSCQASSMSTSLAVSGILSAGSSILGEDSLSHNFDRSIGLHLMDKWTFFMLLFMEDVQPLSNLTLKSLLDSLSPQLIQSTPYFMNSDIHKELHFQPITDFFGGEKQVHFSVIYLSFCTSKYLYVRFIPMIYSQFFRSIHGYSTFLRQRICGFFGSFIFCYLIIGFVYLLFIFSLCSFDAVLFTS